MVQMVNFMVCVFYHNLTFLIYKQFTEHLLCARYGNIINIALTNIVIIKNTPKETILRARTSTDRQQTNPQEFRTGFIRQRLLNFGRELEITKWIISYLKKKQKYNLNR